MENPADTESEPILDSLDVIQNELIRLKAIEQAAKDYIQSVAITEYYDYSKLSNPLLCALEPEFKQAAYDWKNLKELVN